LPVTIGPGRESGVSSGYSVSSPDVVMRPTLLPVDSVNAASVGSSKASALLRTTRSGSRPRASIRWSASSSPGCARAEYAARVLDHVDIRVSDLGASERFYDTVLPVIGRERIPAEGYVEWGDFAFLAGDDEHPVTRRLHVGFYAETQELVDAFHRAGTEAGYRDDGAPGPRPEYGPDYYGGFLLDPDGNSVEAVNDEQPRKPGAIDHLWIRVADVAAATRFYETIAPHAGIRLEDDTPERAQFAGSNGSFSLVAGDAPTEHLHMAFGAVENATVDSFHRAATEAGYADNGAPGERPIYHAGYYAAFVLDPDSNNIEVVNHNR
jgi:catechol 2,3-dioxygenase-like lactoylglutathione lyase family enzyme